MTPEGRIKNEIKKVLKEYPSIYAFWPVQSGYGSKTLDVLICAYGYFISIEAKAPGNTPTNLQWKTIGDIQRAGGVACVVDSKESAHSLRELFDKLRKHPPHDGSTSKREAQDAGRPGRSSGTKLVSSREIDAEFKRYVAVAARATRNVPTKKARLSSTLADPDALRVARRENALRRATEDLRASNYEHTSLRVELDGDGQD
jgi:hypothetical protein